VVLRQKVLVPTADSRLVTINLEDGRLTGEVRFSQNVRSLVVDRDEKHGYVVGHHTNLYVLDLGAGACAKVVYLGHEPGSIRAAPLLIDTYLLVAENIGTKFSRFLALGLEEGGATAKVVQVTEPPLDGQIQLSPVVQGRQIVAATDLGAVYVFDISPGGEKILSQTQVSAPTLTSPLVPYPLVRGSQLWVADKQLVRYDIQLNTGRLVPRWAKDTGDTFLQPLEASGEILFHARRRSGVRGVNVSAVRLEDGERLWEIHLAAPAATGAIVDPSGAAVSALTAAGELYRVPAADLRGHQPPAAALAALAADSPEVGLLQNESIAILRLGSTALVAWRGALQALLVDPQPGAPSALRWIELPDRPGCAPLIVRGRLLVPGLVGQVYLLDVAAGRQAAQPFQAVISGRRAFSWNDADGPPDASDGEFYDDLVLGDGDKSLYRIGLRSVPVDHLAAFDKADLTDAIASPVGRVGGWAYAVDAKQRLVAFELPALTPRLVQLPSEKPQLAGRPVWGPKRVGRHVLLVTDDGWLYCLGGEGKLAWHAELADGPLAGAPLAVDGRIVLISQSGAVVSLDDDTGRAIGKIDVGQPLGPGAALLGERLVLPGHDGTLHFAPLPVSSAPGKTPTVASR
jgi:outer membrane protein assembly factor BamB